MRDMEVEEDSQDLAATLPATLAAALAATLKYLKLVYIACRGSEGKGKRR
jgi:hypothetical protein